jgi:protein ImuB
MRRIACIALPEIRLEVVPPEPHAPAGPVAVVVARPGAWVKTERDILGNTRLDVVSPAARALGVRAGQTVAAARARCADLRVRVVVEGAVQAALARLAEAALAFGPSTSFDVSQDVVWVDVGGCAHLHGGERALAQALEARVTSLGHRCRVAVASGPRLSSAVARFAVSRKPGPLIVPPGSEAAAMRVLPVAALALDPDTALWLQNLGMVKCGDLQKLPRRAFGTRLGARAHDVMQLLDGEDRAPLDPYRPPEVPEERVELEWGAASTEALAFILKSLCDRLAARLQGRALGAARLELVLSLDRALCGNASPLSVLAITLPVPLARAADLLAVVRSRLEHHTLIAPAMQVVLRATELARMQGRTLDLLEPEPVADRALPRLVAELSAELGADRVGVLELVDTWVPDERTRLAPFGARPVIPRHALVTSALEPTRLSSPRALDPHDVTPLLPPVRVEGLEWWRRPSQRRDLVAAWLGAGREGSLAWVELGAHPHDAAQLRGFID